MQQMRQQLKYLQAELCTRGVRAASDEVQVYAIFQNHDLIKLVHFVFREIYAFSCGMLNDLKPLLQQVLRERIAWLEATNEDLSRKLHEYRSRCAITEKCEIDAYVCQWKF